MVVSNLVFHDKRLSWKNSGHWSGMQLMYIKIGLLSVLLLKTCVRKKGGLGGFAPQTLTRSYYFEPPLSKKRSRATGEYQFLSHWFDLTSDRTLSLFTPSGSEAHALSTRPSDWFFAGHVVNRKLMRPISRLWCCQKNICVRKSAL